MNVCEADLSGHSSYRYRMSWCRVQGGTETGSGSDDYVAVGDLVNLIKYFPENILLITGVLAKK